MAQHTFVRCALRYLLVATFLFFLPARSFASPAVNDARGEAFLIKGPGFFPADNTAATAEVGEPVHGQVGAGRSLWWRWTSNTAQSRTITLRPYRPDLAFVLVVYAVDPEGALAEQARVEASDMVPKSVRFSAEAGADYLLAVDSVGAGEGWFYFSIDQAPEIHVPLAVRMTPGEPFSIPVQISGFPDEVVLDDGFQFFSFDPKEQTIVGSLPADFQDAQIQLQAYNEFGDHFVELSVYQDEPRLCLKSPASAIGFVGVPFEYELEFTGVYPGQLLDFDWNGLPPGFVATYEDGRYVIKGVPAHANQEDVYFSVEGLDPYTDRIDVELKFEFFDFDDVHLTPEITSPLMASYVEGELFSYQVETSFPVAFFYANNLPPWLSINEETGLLSGVPDVNSREQIYITADYPGGHIEGVLHLVPDEGSVPQFLVPPILYAYEGVPFRYLLETSRAARDFESNHLPSWLSLSYEGGVLSGIPTEQGEWAIDIFAQGSSSYEPIEMGLTIKVLDAASIARITSPAQAKGEAGQFFEYIFTTEPAILGAMPLDVFNLPPGLNFDPDTNRIFGVPQYPGPEEIAVMFGENEMQLQFQFIPAYPPDFISAASAVAKKDSFFFFSVNATDADHYTIVGGSLPDGLSLDQDTGTIYGATSIVGEHQIRVRALSVNSFYSSYSLFTLIVEESPSPATQLILSPGHMAGEIGETIIYSISSNSTSSGPYGVDALPEGFYFDEVSGTIYGSSDRSYIRTIYVQHGEASAEVLLTVYPPRPPELLVESAPSALGAPGQWFEFQIETNADELDVLWLDFYPTGPWPEGLSLDWETGLISGYLGEDWPSQLEFDIQWNGGLLESAVTLINSGVGRPPSVTSFGHITSFMGDYVEYEFEFDEPGAQVEIVHNNTSLFYDATQRKLYGYLEHYGLESVEFELVDPDDLSSQVQGTLIFQSLDPSMRPAPLIVSKMAPVLEVGQAFEYQFELDQPNAFIRLQYASEDWIQQTGHLSLSGIVPEDWSPGQVFADLEIETDRGMEQLELWFTVSEYPQPPAVTSPATALAEVGVPFSYQLEVDPLREGDIIQVDAPEWLSYNSLTMRLSGVPEWSGDERVYIFIATDLGNFESIINVAVAYRQSRPIIEMPTPPPGFLNVPYYLPFSVDGFYDFIDYGMDENFQVQSIPLAIKGVPEQEFGNMNFWVSAENSHEFSEIRGEMLFFESAPVFIEDPKSMVTFEGGKALFSLSFGGRANSQGWYKDGSSLLGSESRLEIQNVSVADQGTYALRLENSIGEAISQPAWLTVGTPREIRDWTIAHVGELYEMQPGGQPSESWIGDGISNLLKWSMGLPLLEPNNQPLTGGSMVDGALQLQFSRNTNAEDVSIIVERSGNLASDSWAPIARRPMGGTWQALQSGVTIEESGSGEKRDVTVRDAMVGDQAFLRVRFEPESF